jgi:nitrogen fixation NifU-like protein
MNNDWAYSDIVKEHFLEPKNVLRGDESSFPHNAKGLVGNIICGDQMMVLLNIKNDIILDVRWKTYGCASAIASTSMMSEIIKGMNINEAYEITPEYIATKLGGLPENKFHCSILGDKALRSAINDYLVKNSREPFPEKSSNIICHCTGVTEEAIEIAIADGCKTIEDIENITKAGSVCGGCKSAIQDIINKSKSKK